MAQDFAFAVLRDSLRIKNVVLMILDSHRPVNNYAYSVVEENEIAALVDDRSSFADELAESLHIESLEEGFVSNQT